MIIYSSNKSGFLTDALSGTIDKKIHDAFVREKGHSVGQKEMDSWRDSMPYMNMVLSDSSIPLNAGVAIEYSIPQTRMRIDFVITGLDENNVKNAVIIELKRWSKGVHLSDKDGVVETDFYGESEVSHPSYQVWTYACLLNDYNSSVQDKQIKLAPCVYLHNYLKDEVISNVHYQRYIEEAPVYYKEDIIKLQQFIKRFIKYGDNKDILYDIDNGKIRPSKSLADSLSSMLNGNPEFLLIDDQKVVYETALQLANRSTNSQKNILIVEGGPGTGKSVLAINLLVELTKQGKLTQYVTKNSAPRSVYQIKLSGSFSKTRISNLFTSSGSFIDIAQNTFDVLLVDEAHRLNSKSGIYFNLGENQIKELINASRCTVFFIDEDQRISLKDIGTQNEILKWANYFNIPVQQYKLSSQFRCSGSDGYIAWIDNCLNIKETANDTINFQDFDFKIFDSPTGLHNQIKKLNINNKARVVAGYCWNWVSKVNKNEYDIIIDDYKAKWNLNEHGQSWIVQPDSVTEVGCIHTCQGLEVEYIGVIIGHDLVIRNGQVVTDYHKRAKTDQSLKGINILFKNDPQIALHEADRIIKNTYRTLMTRGLKGCYIYSQDEETRNYFKQQLQKSYNSEQNKVNKTDFIYNLD